jgi:septum formation protein
MSISDRGILPGKHLILASGSPRRQLLLSALGFSFEVRIREIDETCPADIRIEALAEHLAVKKSEEFSAEDLQKEDILITADTIVVLDSKVIGKPVSKADAVDMLTALSGNMHLVYTGVCIRSVQKRIAFTEMTKVWFAELSNEEIENYINSHQPFDKAGAYGIQEWTGYAAITRVEGSFYNVMGLPTHRVYRELMRF